MKTTITSETKAESMIGLHTDLSNDFYHNSGIGYSASDIIAMSDSFAYWKWKKAQPKVMSQDMLIGSVTHTILEARLKNDGSIIDRDVVLLPSGIGYKSVKFEPFALEHKGKYPIAQDDLDMANRLVDAVFVDPEVSGYFTRGITEASIYAYYPGTEVLMKTRPDYLRVADGLSINFKTTRDASYQGFIRSVADGSYDWQSGIYVDLLAAHFGKTFDEIHVLVEKTEDGPIRLGVFTIDDDDLAFARSQYQQIIHRIPQCEQSGHWPKSSTQLQQVRLPAYAKKVVSL